MKKSLIPLLSFIKFKPVIFCLARFVFTSDSILKKLAIAIATNGLIAINSVKNIIQHRLLQILLLLKLFYRFPALLPSKKVIIFALFTLIFSNKVLADYTISVGTTVDPNTTPSLLNATGTISIYGTMAIYSDVTFTSTTPLTILIYGTTGQIYWYANKTLALPFGSSITFVNNPMAPPGLQPTSGSASQILQIGTVKYAAANDHSNNVVFSFAQVNSIGGTATVNPSTSTPNVCLGSSISFSANQIIPSGTNFYIIWSISSSPGTFNNNNTSTAINTTLSGLAAGSNTVTCELYADGGGGSYYLVSTESVMITVSVPPSATISYPGSPYCYNTGNANVTFSGTSGGTYSSSPSGALINSSNGTVNLASSAPGTYTVTYTVAASGGCSIYSTSTQIVINPNTWVGKANSNWNTSGNWAATYSNTCPDVTILGGVPYQPLLNSGTISIQNLIIDTGANLTLTNTTLQISGTITNSGTFDVSAGTLEMNGSSAQTIAGSMFAQKTIKNLIVSNTGTGLSVSSTANDTLKITGTLSFGNPNSKLNTGDNIDLVSDINATANVGVVNPGNIITGKVIAERYIPTGISHGKSWQLLAVPTNSQTIKESWMEGGLITTTPNGYGA
ncbi:MAG TPA: hypothetical protein VIL78_20925 [Hanamia sp.]